MDGLTCRICAGPLRLARRGAEGDPSARTLLLAPTNHLPRQYSDLYRCVVCGSIEQPGLPRGAALLDLYRTMRDDDYLAEEEGRRRTAARLVEALGPPPRDGRLLEVGCGHGLLLDEARRRGWSVRGLDLSVSAAAHARDELGLDVDEVPVEDASLDGRHFDAIALVDVLEHLDDPVGTLRRCRELLGPGGALVVVTPDPASPTARLAGARWWGLLPAHTCLVPRATLQGILRADGLRLVHDGALVRTFSLGYWVRGLIERGGAAPPAARRALSGRAARRLVSVNLGDERVMLARRPTAPAARPGAVTDTLAPAVA